MPTTSTSLPTVLNLRPPISDAVLGTGTGTAATLFSTLWQNYFTNLNRELNDLAKFNPSNYGAAGTGVVDDSGAIQAAVTAAITNGGGSVVFDPGTYLCNNPISIPQPAAGADTVSLFFQGTGSSTQIIRGASLKPGMGMIDVNSANISFSDILFDGGTTTSVGLQYGVGFTGTGGDDPMAASLTTNTTIWVHGNASGVGTINFYRCTFQHAGGYSILLDATQYPLQNIDIFNCWFVNNRPTTFGATAGQLVYGSWNGGVFAQGNGVTGGSSVVSGLNVSFCRFLRNTGNCLWSHSYGLNEFHKDFRFIGNFFEDCGLDGIEPGAVSGGIVANNIFHRVGYVCANDTSPGVPSWLANKNATALDSAIVKGMPYVDNTFLSINGGCMDLDGHGDSAISGNVCRTPYSGEPEYVEDQIAITGPDNNASSTYGVNTGNTEETTYGSQYVNVVGNTFINLAGGAIRFYTARNCQIRANVIVSPAAPASPPIIMGPTSSNAEQRCFNNKIASNDIYYSPANSQPAIFEDDTASDFLSTEINYVYDNFPIGTGNAFEFEKSTHSGSFTSSFFPPTLNFISAETGANSAIACAAGSGATLTEGLIVSILLAHTLTGGAPNTFAYNGGGTVGIASHLNPANNIAASYVVGSIITLMYSGSVWLDVSQ